MTTTAIWVVTVVSGMARLCLRLSQEERHDRAVEAQMVGIGTAPNITFSHAKDMQFVNRSYSSDDITGAKARGSNPYVLVCYIHLLQFPAI